MKPFVLSCNILIFPIVKCREGSIRCDVNVSVMEAGSGKFGTRCEMKNVNSFSGAVRAIEYEAKRQIAVLEAGGVIEQETRKWDDVKGESILLRSKEDAQDYRYFPEPDLSHNRSGQRVCGPYPCFYSRASKCKNCALYPRLWIDTDRCNTACR